MTQRQYHETDWMPIFIDMLHVLNHHHVGLTQGEAIFAYGLGYARGLQQRPIMDDQAIQNVHLGWAHGAAVETTEFSSEEETKS